MSTQRSLSSRVSHSLFALLVALGLALGTAACLGEQTGSGGGSSTFPPSLKPTPAPTPTAVPPVRECPVAASVCQTASAVQSASGSADASAFTRLMLPVQADCTSALPSTSPYQHVCSGAKGASAPAVFLGIDGKTMQVLDPGEAAAWLGARLSGANLHVVSVGCEERGGQTDCSRLFAVALGTGPEAGTMTFLFVRPQGAVEGGSSWSCKTSRELPLPVAERATTASPTRSLAWAPSASSRGRREGGARIASPPQGRPLRRASSSR